MKLNNKGQSLVTVVLLLPLVILIIAAVFDIGNIMITQNKYENEIKNTIQYGLKNSKEPDIEQKIQTLLASNLKGFKEITVDENFIKIHVKDKRNGLFSTISKKQDIDITYHGTIENGKIIITKE